MSGPVEDDRIPEPVAPLPLPDFEYDDLEKEERIGTGGDADVYRATIDHNGYTYPVAVKEPRFEGTIQKRVIEKFETEAETWSSLSDQDNIVSVYGWGSEPLPWLGLEFMDGGTLDAQIGSLDVAQALWLSGRIAEGIHYGHRHGVAHLDIKPTNVLLRDTPDSKWKYPKVSDWGLAKMLLEHSNSIEGISPTYAAPEQFDAEEYGSPDDITDIYQLGSLVYALVAGEPPFSGSSTAVMQGVLQEEPDPPSAVSSEVPAAVDEVVLKALAKEKDDRYESVVLFRKELDRLFDAYSADGGNATTTGGVSSGRESKEQTTKRRTDSRSETTAAQAAETGDHKSQTPSSSRESHGGTAPSGSTTQGGTGDDSSLLSRRSALSLLGVGALGGGGLLVTQMGNDDEGASAAPSGTGPGTTQNDTPTEQRTEQGEETEGPEKTSTESNNSDNTENEDTNTRIVIDDFENTSSLGWSIESGGRSRIEFTDDSPQGRSSLYFKHDSEDTPTIISKSVDLGGMSEFSFWMKYDSQFNNPFRLFLENSSGDRIIAFQEANEAIRFWDPQKEGEFIKNTEIAEARRNTWYKVSATNIDFTTYTMTIGVYTRDGTLVNEVQDVGFWQESDEISQLILRNGLGNNGNPDPLWIDHISYTL